MKRYPFVLAVLWALLEIGLQAAGAQSAPAAGSPGPPPPYTLGFGISQCYEGRCMTNVFNAAQEQVQVQLVKYSRNPTNAAGTPLPRLPHQLPDVITLTLGRCSEDLPHMADLGLIEPVDVILEDLGLSVDDILPAAREAVTYRGKVWALPAHAVMYSLVAHKQLLPHDTPADSWESLLESSASAADASSESPLVLTYPFSELRLAEQMAAGAGGEVFSCANPRVLLSDPYLKAFRLIAEYKSRGLIAPRPENTPMRKGELALLGMVFLDSIYAGTEFRVLPMPKKIMEQDAPAKRQFFPTWMEAFAVRANNPHAHEAVKTLLGWMQKPESQWMVFQATNDVIQTRDWTLDSVHVPLWESLLNAPLFKDARANFPDYPVLVENARSMLVPRSSSHLDELLTVQSEEFISAHLGDPDFEKGLATLVESLESIVLHTPVEAHAYDAF